MEFKNDVVVCDPISDAFFDDPSTEIPKLLRELKFVWKTNDMLDALTNADNEMEFFTLVNSVLFTGESGGRE